MTYLGVFVGVTLLSYVLAYSGEYVPKSYYLLDEDGHQSEIVFFRSKRAIELFPLLRKKRSGGSSSGVQSSASASSNGGSTAGAGAHSSASSYSSSDSASNGYHPGFGPDFYNLANGHLQSLAAPDSGGFPGTSGYSGFGGSGGDAGYHGPILFSRFGEAEGTGVQVTGSAAGPRAAYSSSSSSIDSNGKIKYSVQSGKY